MRYITKAFKENTVITKTENGYSCECRLMLWSVDAPTKEEALKEGMYYFKQYYKDGEYDK
jgi:hypothetical protein